MGPKKEKKGKKTKEKKDDGAENGGVLTPEEQAKLFLSANRSLQMQLAERHDLAVKAMESKRELQERVGDLQRDFERERMETFGITQDMTRQYKSMQEELLNRVNTLENTNTELRDQLELARVNFEEMKREKDRAIASKNLEIQELKAKMEEMAQEFGDMLKETLDKMRERIEITNTSFEGDGGMPMIRRLEEFNLGSPTKMSPCAKRAGIVSLRVRLTRGDERTCLVVRMVARHERPVQRFSSSGAASGLQRLLCALIAMSLLSAVLLISFHATRPQHQRLRPAPATPAQLQYGIIAQALVVKRVQTGATEEDEETELASMALGAAGYDNTTSSSSSSSSSNNSFVSQSNKSADVGGESTTLFPQEVLLSETPDNYSGIPRIIHQSWKSSSAIPKRFGPWMRSWTSAHSTWTYVFWTDADNLALFETLYPQYLHVAKGVGKIGLADMARYALLHSVGGLYADADFECIRPFDQLLREQKLFLSSEPRAHTVLLEKSDSVSLCNALLASKPKHPLWLKVLDAIRAKFEREGDRDPVGLTGPRILNQTYFEYVDSQHNASTTTNAANANSVVLPPEFFYPEIAYWNIAALEDACKMRQDVAAKDACAWLKQFPTGEFTNSTHATHHWQCTWCNGDGSSEYASLQSIFNGTGSVPHRPQISSGADDGVIAFVPV